MPLVNLSPRWILSLPLKRRDLGCCLKKPDKIPRRVQQPTPLSLKTIHPPLPLLHHLHRSSSNLPVRAVVVVAVAVVGAVVAVGAGAVVVAAIQITLTLSNPAVHNINVLNQANWPAILLYHRGPSNLSILTGLLPLPISYYCIFYNLA